MKNDFSEDVMRVTSIPYRSPKLVIFSGVPLTKGSYTANKGKYYITIKAAPDTIPVQPALGQYWSVVGVRKIESMDTGGYLMQQHTYESPEHTKCTLSESGEHLIQTIAKDDDFKGIGESKAKALWELLGSKFHETCSNDSPESRKRLRMVLTHDSVNALYKGYTKYKNLNHANWMSKYKIPTGVQQRVLKYHGEKTIEAIKENPYLLVGFGMSFNDVDRATSDIQSPIAKNDWRRLTAAIEVALRKEVEKGHTYTTQADLKPHLIKLLKEKELINESLTAGQDKKQYIVNPNSGYYHPTAQLLMESVIAKRLKTLVTHQIPYDENAQKSYSKAISELPYELTDKQTEAVNVSVSNAVNCISGGAGTGKTTVLRTVLRVYNLMGFDIHAITLSGRAAMRLHESIRFPTITIAKFLRSGPIEPNIKSPKHLLVIDEASMLDLPTMYRLISHIHPSVRIIFTGDPNQLPPIGCGKIFADLVSSNRIKNTMLDIVKRQDGSTGIPEYSSLINEGIVPKSLSSGAIHFHETKQSEIPAVCANLYEQSPHDSRIIAPTKKLVSEINELTQNLTNKSGARLCISPFLKRTLIS